MSYSNRFYLYLPAALLLAAAILYTLFWRAQAAELSQALEGANGHELVPGLNFAFAEKSVAGFPFRLDVILSGVTFSQASADGDYAWRTEKLALHAQSYSRSRWIFEAAGLQSFALPPATAGAVPRIFLVNQALARASAVLAGGRPVRFDMDLWGPNGREATEGAKPGRSFSAARVQFHALARAGETFDVALKVENARIGAGFSTSSGDTDLPLIELLGALSEARTLEPLLAGASGLGDAARSWRDSKGVFAIASLVLNAPDRKTGFTGELTLSPAYEVTGTLRDAGGATLDFADGTVRLEAGSASAGATP